jgi:uncharacterized delta-60 repeat protein
MIQGANDAPNNITGTLTIAENSANGSVVGTVTGQDVDTGDSFTYSLTDTAGGRFAINAATGQVTVANGSLIDFETNASHTITVRVTDLAGATFDKVLTVSVTNTNDAAVLNASASPTLGIVLEGATNPSGVSVASLVVDGSITDTDGSAVEAIAITGLNASLGTWQYSLNGGTSWLTIDANLINNNTNELALLLGPTAQLRMIPFGDVNGSVSDGITFRAWDQTSGSEGQYAVISATGGTSAFSTASDTASITVTAVNDAPTFLSGDGIVTTAIGTSHDIATSVTIQPDGMIVVAGVALIGSTDDFALARYNADGSLDTSFGTGGKVTTAIGTNTDMGYSVTIQADGKIVVAGIAVIDGSPDFALVRYNANGSLDTSFGTGGMVTTAIVTGINKGYSVTVQPDGKIVVGGHVYIGSTYDFALVRYNANGTLDTSFGTGGKVTTAIVTAWDIGNSVTIQPDGKILVAGQATIGSTQDFAMVRYNANGTLDTSFGTGGKVTTDIGTSHDQGKSVTIQPDGKIVVAGQARFGSNDDFALVRYNADGSLDTSFGTGGKVTTAIGTAWDSGYSVTLQPDGKIVVAGIAYIGSTYDFALVRYNADGSLDTSFGTGGKVTTAIGTSNDQGWSVTIQADGKIVVAGLATIGSTQDIAVVRYNADGSLDTTFDRAGTLGGSVSYTVNGTPVVLDSDVRVFDAELSSSNFSGATLTLVRNGGANGQDLFSATGTLGTLTQGGNLTVGGTTIGTVTTNSSGSLVLTFNSSATNALVNSAMQQIAYANSSNALPASAQIDWTFNDGNSGVQGTGGALTATGNVVVNITAVNDAPVAVADTAIAVEAGGVANGTAGADPSGNVLTSDTDVDSGDTKTVSGVAAGIVGSATTNVGSAVTGTYGSINISSTGAYTYTVDNSIAAVQALRTSANTLTDTFTYTMRDAAGLTSTTQVTVTIQGANDAPHDMATTGLTVSEKAANTTNVGTITRSDVDASDTPSYSLVDSAGGRFAINASTGVVTVANSSLLNYELAASHNITVRVTDLAGATYDEVFIVNLTDADEFDVTAPADLNATANAVNENASIGTVVGITASSSDADATTNTVTYSLFDNDGGNFGIDANTGVVTTAAALNRETLGASWNIMVRATSTDGSTADTVFTIAINDLDEFDTGAVTDANATANTVAENAANGTVVGITASASDADATTNTITYTLDDNASGRFAVNSSTGVVTVGGTIDYETSTSHSVTVRATSADGSFSTQVFTIQVTDVNEGAVGPVTDNNPAANFVRENSSNGTLVELTGLATDPDGSDTVSYSLDDTAGGRFAINSTTGVVTVAGGIDREASGSYNLTIRATSSDASFSTQSFTITVGDIDEFDVGAVTDTNASSNNVNENAAVGTTVGIIATASDADATTNAITYTLTDDAGGRFAINSSTGVLTVANGLLLDRETAASHNIAVRATSADASFQTRTFTINLIDQNDVAPVIAPNQQFSVSELATIGTVVGDVAATDADGVGALQNWTIVSGNSDNVFSLNATTGRLTISDVTRLSFESTNRYTLTLSVSDGSSTSSLQTIEISILAENEAPVFTPSSALNVHENAANGTVVGSVSATDVDSGDVLRYSILSSSPVQAFVVDAVSGEIRVSDSSQLNLEMVPSVTLNIQVTDAAGLVDTQWVTINLSEINEAPTDIVMSGGLVTENAGAGTFVATFAGVDADAGESLVYSLIHTGGPGGSVGQVTIDSSTGQLTVAAGAALDFESAATLLVAVQITDSQGFAFSKSFTINITDINDAPMAYDDHLTALQLQSLDLSGRGVLGNDFDDDGDVFRAILVSGPAHGTLTLNADGTLSYLSTDLFSGTDSFQYQITDGSVTSNIATVIIDVLPSVSPGGGGGGGGASTDGGTTGTGSETGSGTGTGDGNESGTGGGSGGSTDSMNASTDTGSNTEGTGDQAATATGSEATGELGSQPALPTENVTDGAFVGAESLNEAQSGSMMLMITVQGDFPDARDLQDDTLSDFGRESSGGDQDFRLFRSVFGGYPVDVNLRSAIASGVFFTIDKVAAPEDSIIADTPPQVVEKIVVGSAAVVSTSLSVGYVIWILRGGTILTTFVSALPAWQSFDPLPILQSVNRKDEADNDSLLSIATRRTRNNKSRKS